MKSAKPVKPKYSQAILTALRSKGFSLASVQRAARASAEFILAVLDGQREFSDAQIGRLETLSGFSGGQLAAAVYEPDRGELANLMDVLAASRSSNFKRRGLPRKRSAARKLATHAR
jgi:hypothetical protein